MTVKSRAAAGAVVATAMLVVGCHFGPTTPSTPQVVGTQIYQTLITAQALLNTVRASSSNSYLTEHKLQINQAIGTYNTLEAGFVTFVQAPNSNPQQLVNNEAALAAQLTQLIISFTQPLSPQKANTLHRRAQIRATAQFNLSSFLSYLQIAAAVASQIPGTAPWGGLATIVLQAAQAASVANTSITGVDVTQLHTIPLLV